MSSEPFWPHETEKLRAAAMLEIENDIKMMVMAGILKIEDKLPKSFDIKTASAYQSESWKIGYGTCLAQVKRIIDEVKRKQQKDLIKFVTDPKTIAKAVEGSMEKRSNGDSR